MSDALPDIPVRWHRHENRVAMTLPFLAPDHALADTRCLLCNEPLANEHAVVLLALGPGGDPERQAACRRGKWFDASALCLHAACAGV